MKAFHCKFHLFHLFHSAIVGTNGTNGTHMLYPESESSTLEFKSKISKSDQIINTMIAFCNHLGGRLIIGVEDDRAIVGIADEHLEDLLQWIEKAVYEASFPPIIPSTSVQRIEDKNLFISPLLKI